MQGLEIKRLTSEPVFPLHALLLSVAGGLGAFPQHMPSFPPAGQELRLNSIVTERLARALTGPYANVNEYRTPSVPSTPSLYETLNFFAFTTNMRTKHKFH